MRISAATPSEILNIFLNSEVDSDILCIFLSASAAGKETIKDLIYDYQDADAALGNSVTFLLLYPEANDLISTLKDDWEYVIPGSSGKKTVAIRDIWQNSSDLSTIKNREIAEEIAFKTARFVPEMMGIFDVKYQDMPAICILTKPSGEARVIPLGTNTSSEKLKSIFSSLSNIVNKYTTKYTPPPYDYMKNKLPVIEENKKIIESARKTRNEVLKNLLNIVPVTKEEMEKLEDYFNQDPSPKSPETFLESIVSSKNVCDKFAMRVKKRMSKIRKHSKKICEAEQSTMRIIETARTMSNSFNSSMSERKEKQKMIMEEIEKFNPKSANIEFFNENKTKSTDILMGILKFVDRATSIIQKIDTLIRRFI